MHTRAFFVPAIHTKGKRAARSPHGARERNYFRQASAVADKIKALVLIIWLRLCVENIHLCAGRSVRTSYRLRSAFLSAWPQKPLVSRPS
jgi:hypothetical protein